MRLRLGRQRASGARTQSNRMFPRFVQYLEFHGIERFPLAWIERYSPFHQESARVVWRIINAAIAGR